MSLLGVAVNSTLVCSIAVFLWISTLDARGQGSYRESGNRFEHKASTVKG